MILYSVDILGEDQPRSIMLVGCVVGLCPGTVTVAYLFLVRTGFRPGTYMLTCYVIYVFVVFISSPISIVYFKCPAVECLYCC